MAVELSANWKKLQAKIKAESSAPRPKRKAADVDQGQQTGMSDKRATLKGRQQTQQQRSRLKPANSHGKCSSQTPKMGATLSVILENQASLKTPDLALWAEDNDVSLEDVAQEYRLGLNSDSYLVAAEGKPNEGLVEGLDVGKYVAMDCEMVGVGPHGRESALARVTITDFHGRLCYESFVRPKERVVDWRTPISGIRPTDMENARELEAVQADVANLLKGRILVGHDVRHDLESILLSHPARQIRDTSRFSVFKKYANGRKPALRVLAQEILGLEIQTGEHCSLEDARVSMLLFRKFKSGFEAEHAQRYPETPPVRERHKADGAKKPKRKKKKKKLRH
jgi:RNA exonuclease 4